MEELVQLVIKTYGIIGLVMLSPFVGIMVLWRYHVKMQDKNHKSNEELQNKLNELNQKRVDDSKAIIDKLLLVAGEQGALSKETNMALDRVGDLLSIISSLPSMKPR